MSHRRACPRASAPLGINNRQRAGKYKYLKCPTQDSSEGEALFPGISAKQFNCQLRKHMAACGAPSAESFTRKGFRRGHAQDISRRYGISPELKAAGGWTTIAGALCYDSREELEDLFVTKERKRKTRARQASSDSSSSSSDD